MGLIVLHSGHFSKIFRRMLGTNCSLKWREADEKERLWVVEPSHPIAAGLPEYFELPYEEMYGERFDIPQPDSTVFISWFEGGEVFRSGCTWERGHGRIFYFRPGHEAYPTYHDANVQRVLANAVQWAAPRVQIVDVCPESPALEPIAKKNVSFAKAGVPALYVKGGVDNIEKGRDAGLAMPNLILPSVQINIRAGEMPPAEANGKAYLKIPLNVL